MPKAELPANLCCSFVDTEENDLNVRVKLLPTSQSIALDHSDVTSEGLRSGEEGQHPYSLFGRLRNPVGPGQNPSHPTREVFPPLMPTGKVLISNDQRAQGVQKCD